MLISLHCHKNNLHQRYYFRVPMLTIKISRQPRFLLGSLFFIIHTKQVIMVTSIDLPQNETTESVHDLEKDTLSYTYYSWTKPRPLKTSPNIWYFDQLRNWILQENSKSCAKISFSFKQYVGSHIILWSLFQF